MGKGLGSYTEGELIWLGGGGPRTSYIAGTSFSWLL